MLPPICSPWCSSRAVRIWWRIRARPEVLRLVRLAKLARGLRVVRMARIMDSLNLLPPGSWNCFIVAMDKAAWVGNVW